MLGPTLSNIFLNDVLRLDIPKGTSSIGYADGLALIVTTKTQDVLKEGTKCALRTIKEWLTGEELELENRKAQAGQTGL